MTGGRKIMDIVITYLAPRTGGHSGIEGHHSEMRFNSFDDARDWVFGNIPKEQRPAMKLWANDVQITGATRAATLRPMPLAWVEPQNLF